MYVKNNGGFIQPNQQYIRVNGVYVPITSVHVKDNGVYKPVWETVSKRLVVAGTRSGMNDGIDTYYYEEISNQLVTIDIGDKLKFSFGVSPYAPVSVDAILSNGNRLSQSNLFDTDGYNINASSIAVIPPMWGPLGSSSYMHTRTFDLSSLSGQGLDITSWAIVNESDQNGTYYSFFSNIVILDSNNQIKATVFKDTLDVPQLKIWTPGGYYGFIPGSFQKYII